MKIIDKSVYDYDKDVSNFKEELESNILIEINELMKKDFNEDDAVKYSIENTRSTYKISVVIIAISLILFIIWEILNIILVKRSKNFFFKVLPKYNHLP